MRSTQWACRITLWLLVGLGVSGPAGACWVELDLAADFIKPDTYVALHVTKSDTPNKGTISLEKIYSGDGRVTIWKEDLSEQVPSLDVESESWPVLLYVKGDALSSAIEDVTIKATWTWVGDPPGSPKDDEDECTVAVLDLYRDCTTWTGEAKLRDGAGWCAMFLTDQAAGIQFKGPKNETIQVRAYATGDEGNTLTITLTQTAPDSGIYRNANDDGPFLAPAFNAGEKKVKIVDEDESLVAYLYFGGKEYYEILDWAFVDLAEVAAVDGTETLDAEEFHGDMASNNWYAGDDDDDKRLFDKTHDKGLGDDDKCVELGNKVDFMYVAGHSHRDVSPTRIYGDDDTYGLNEEYDTNNLQKADIPDGKWAEELEWLVLATCSSCCIFESTKTGPGTEWVAAMADGTHGVMGYMWGAPPVLGVTDVQIAHEFVTALGSQTIKDAWIDTNFAHKVADPTHVYSPLMTVAIFRNSNVDDQVGHVSNFPTDDSTTAEYTYYYIDWTPDDEEPYVDLEENPPTKASFAYNP